MSEGEQQAEYVNTDPSKKIFCCFCGTFIGAVHADYETKEFKNQLVQFYSEHDCPRDPEQYNMIDAQRE